ncbi:hypothetical protein H0H87_008697 [Tephrocybe sp. NHM501043]|nr:hypothetical protein H0H87_008697 [Tephrocybe sp. NHM501043]
MTNEVFLALLVYFDRMSKLSGDAVDHSFVVDSFNIHHFVIAGVTIASKFFSDVFYTNSRYAKVGGLPLAEFNQLKLQFLLLNDFRLVLSSAEMQRYAEQLVLFSSSADPQTQQNPHPHTHPLPLTHPHMPNPLPRPRPCPLSSAPSPAPSEMEGETEAETETETETEADTEANTEANTEMTDDELMIRPGQGSIASASTSDAGSVYSRREAEEVVEEEERQARIPVQPWCARMSSSSSRV